MKISVKLFAAARELIGQPEIKVEIGSPPTVARLRDALAGLAPQMTALLPYATFAIDGEYADETAVIGSEAEVALIPPVSGG